MTNAGAEFDPTGTYRYSLWREWEPRRPRTALVMLNPSTADAAHDDPTIRRCIRLARAWDYGALEVVNLFAYRATDPTQLRRAADPIGPRNDDYLRRAGRRAADVILAWGNGGRWQGRGAAVLRLLGAQKNLLCLGITRGRAAAPAVPP